MAQGLAIYLIFINLLAFAAGAWDKFCAVRHKWRVRERTLFLLALLGGAAGLLACMLLLRHKTRHRSFMLGVPAILAGELLLGAALYLKWNGGI